LHKACNEQNLNHNAHSNFKKLFQKVSKSKGVNDKIKYFSSKSVKKFAFFAASLSQNEYK